MKKLISICILLVMVSLFSASTMLGRTKLVVKQGMDLETVFAGTNMKYVIREDIDLGGKKVCIGAGSLIAFQGGSLSNGTVVGNHTKVRANNYEVFKRGYTRYRAYISNDASQGAPPSLVKKYHNCIFIEGTWDNKKCGSNWTGLLNDSYEDIMISLKNYIMLHREGIAVQCPRFNAFGYETTYFPNGYSIDFNNSTISYPDCLSIWEDSTIPLPDNSKPCNIESGFGLVSLRSDTVISNLSIDGKSTKRQHETIRLGVSCAICIGRSTNVLLKNIRLSNVLGPGVDVNSGAKDITFLNCTFYNIGEHVFYSHQYRGYCRFIGCEFDTWDSERLSTYRNGLNYLFKYAPPVNSEDFLDNEAYLFDLSFTNCSFNNPKRITSQGRTLGGFLTGYFPVIVRIENCRFTGVLPPFNPGISSMSYASTRKPYRMIVKNCDGAPYAYAAKSNYNIIAEFYDCKNIPFRTVYAKRYENCYLSLDVYENNDENVSPSFEDEFLLPLVVKNCSFSDNGQFSKINHPICHRPVIFDSCVFSSSVSRAGTAYVISIQNESIPGVSFTSCRFDAPKMSLIGGPGTVETVSISNCSFINSENQLITPRTKQIEIVNNTFHNTKPKFSVNEKITKIIVKNNKSIDNSNIDDFIIRKLK